ncbi:hypothetical protein RM704_07650 [Streptomyces sp. DSM 3412]|uniref:Uncharacterized protein n=1 Tax=Streptomyces gottesmaniae TaxID=3075518 RepID=A0ABU2YSN2_9ACTN|nr:hypothetical protein [Streptomyces sp. DSM 3412]MDT0567337.1 hypothetical protein [Streptomyces sp. DSM 3412]
MRGSRQPATQRPAHGSGQTNGRNPAHSSGSGEATEQTPARGAGQAGAGRGPGRDSGQGINGRGPTRGSGQSFGQSAGRSSVADGGGGQRRAEHPRFSDFRRTANQNAGAPATPPPPPAASARFPDTPPTTPTPSRDDRRAARTRHLNTPPPTATRSPGEPPAASARFPDEPPAARRPDDTPPPASARFPDSPPAAHDTGRRTAAAGQSAGARAGDSGATLGDRASRPTGPSEGGSSRPADRHGASPHPPGQPPTSARRDRVPAPGGTVPPPASPLRRPLPEEAGPEGTPRPRPLTPERPGGWQPPSSSSRRSAEALDGVLGTSSGRPFVTFAQPDTSAWTPPDPHDGRRKPRPTKPRAAAVAACVVLGIGLIGGAAAGSWLTGDAGADDSRSTFATAGELWHGVPVDALFPPTVQGEGAGPGGTDRTWTRIAVAPDSGCADAFDPLLRKALAPVGCLRLLRATYTDATRSNVTTVGLLFTKTDAAAMTALKARFAKDGLDRRTDLMPRPYAAEDTVAAGFGDDQRASWTISVLTDVPVVVYAVSGFADGRTVTDPQAAADAMKPGATTAPAQSGLGHEAKGLADRIERGLRKTAASATEQPS